MGGYSVAAQVRRVGLAVFAGAALLAIVAAVISLFSAPPEHWAVAAVGVLCAGVLELTWVRLGSVAHRSPMVALPVLALPALATLVSVPTAIGAIALGVLLAVLLEAGRVTVALYSAGLQSLGGLLSVGLFAGFRALGLADLAAVAAGCVGYVGFVLLVEVLRKQIIDPPVDRGGRALLSPARMAGAVVGATLVAVLAAFWSVAGPPFLVEVSATVNTLEVLLGIVIVASIVKVVSVFADMRRRLAGLVAGASSLSADAETGARSGAEIAEVLCQAVADSVGVEAVVVRAEPARPGEISLPLSFVAPGAERYIVVSRDAMDGAFTGNDRRALAALVTTAEMVVKAGQNVAGLTLRANTDPLTGLPNYGAFQAALANINDHRDYSEALAVLFLDLDDFKRLNDRHGHSAGDEVLRELGRRLRAVVRPDDLVARVGGDEFVVILTHLTSLGEAKVVAERILATTGEPLIVGPTTFNPMMSIGLAYSAHRETDVTQLVQDADRAMLAIKKTRRRGGSAHESSINISSHRSSQMNDIIARAIDEDLLELAFQPIVSLVTGQIWAFEALVRYTDPDLGPLSPPSIVEKAKGLGRLDAMTRQVAVKAMAAAADFRLVEPRVVCMTFNVEAGQILPDRVGTFVEDLADRYPGISLCLELNERSMAKVTPAIRAQADRMRDLGLMIALDDYGSQDSSVDSLVRMPMDILKIDKSLVDDLDDIRQREVLTALQGFGDNLEYSMIVEGVENETMASHLSALGIRSAQGFHYGVPESFEHTLNRLEQFGAAAVVPRIIPALVRDTFIPEGVPALPAVPGAPGPFAVPAA
ncbi:diguanylate cyclase (GGDEF)-like protein [Cryobacterium sp. MP_M3]|uniref:putative bifunctional diguanylate cyclase/phosphodiesterase n=1 Tax=unclassified Cryobacterium TaxID=2649013 RepID=UPI0018CB6939|nr:MULTISPECIES: EAL domain-containing protein [unclassified Cryobacterium]MBG6056881.1 diguanylate cyclase (GGDEF)-like protein [Cryobacterium sp. MP_M3]